MTTETPTLPSAQPKTRESFSRWRRVLLSLNLAAIVFLTLYILVILAIIIFFHPRRIDLTFERIHTLSEGTVKRLSLVEQDVRVIMPILFQDESALSKIQQEIFARSRMLLDQYVAKQPRIKIEHVLNLRSHQDVTTWIRLQEEYGLVPNQINSFIFVSGEKGEFRQVVSIDELAIYDRPQSKFDSKPPQIHKFLGEEAFTSAITRLIRKDQKKIYFSVGNGEIPFGDSGGHGMGYMMKELNSNGYAIDSHSLLKDGPVPSDCDIFVMASPSRTIDEKLRGYLNEYLLNDGKLFITLTARETGIEKLISEWGITVEPGNILQKDQLGATSYAYWNHEVAFQSRNSQHPITRDIQASSFYIKGGFARALTAATRKDDFSGEWLYRTQARPVTFIDANQNSALDPGERQGQVVGAVTVSKPIPERPPPGFKIQKTRLVVFGDGSALSNSRYNQFTHRTLVLNTFRWLAGYEEEIAGSDGQEWSERTIKWSPGIERFLFWVPIFVIPGLILILGVMVFLARRS